MPTDIQKKLMQGIRDIPDFPKPGIIFKDITPMLANPPLFAKAVEALIKPMMSKRVDYIAGIEARGFLLASAAAYKLKAGLVPVRKKGKLPAKTVSATYDLEYGQDTLEIHADAFKKGSKVLIVDDVLATGGTAGATIQLVEKAGGKVIGTSFLIELCFLNGREKLRSTVHSVLQF